MSYIQIPANESGLPFALEQYYKELCDLIGERDGQPILLNNTITTFDVVKEAPFYTEGVFRNFADRKYLVSPRNIGNAVETDRFSYEYDRVIKIASTQIDDNLDTLIRQRIENLKAEISRVSHELVEFENRVTENWNKIVQSEGLKPETPGYQLRRISYLESILYADQRRLFSEDIEDYQRSILNLRESSYTPDQQKLLRAFDELSESYQVARPWNIYFERDFPNSSVLTFADPTVRSRQFCDVSPAIYPSVNLVLFQERNTEKRNITVTENTIHNELHERTWGASGSSSFRAFGLRFGGSGGGSGSSSYKREFSSLKSFSMNFDGISEIYANRGLWYDPSLFESSNLKPIFDKIPGARDLKNVAVSLVVAKGLSLKLNFNETLMTENWTRRRFSASGGVSVFGFRFGGSGETTSYDYDFKLSEDKKSVEFTDDPKHCRIIAIRLEQIYHPENEDKEKASLLWHE